MHPMKIAIMPLIISLSACSAHTLNSPNCLAINQLPADTHQVTVNWYTDGIDIYRFFWPSCPNSNLDIDIAPAPFGRIDAITNYSAIRKLGGNPDYIITLQLEGEIRRVGNRSYFVASQIVAATNSHGEAIDLDAD